MLNTLRTPFALGDEPAKILIIDDEPNVLSVLYSLLSDKYECIKATSAVEALGYLKEGELDLILSDIMMPGMTGLELLEEITQVNPEIVVILISGNLNIQSAIEAMRRGAFDYVTKPFNLSDVETAVERALRHRKVLKANKLYEQHLEELVSIRTNELSTANANLNATLEKLYINYRATLKSLAAALEARDVETRGHSDRVVAYCIRLGKQIGLSDIDMIALECGALLHDIGKIGVPDAILFKPGPLTDEEWVQMRRHVSYGAQILRGIDFLEGAAKVVAQHHEKYDGSGYPRGITGQDIYIGARIFAVADAVDAFTSDRPYRAGRSFEEAVKELERCQSQHFDPMVVEAFKQVSLSEWREIRRTVSEPTTNFTGTSLDRRVIYSVLSAGSGNLAVS